MYLEENSGRLYVDPRDLARNKSFGDGLCSTFCSSPKLDLCDASSLGED